MKRGSRSGTRQAFRTLLISIGNTNILRAFSPPGGRAIDAAALCSVVPALTRKFSRQIRKQYGITPRLLTASTVRGLTIRYRNPALIGADRIACALGARALYPRANVIIVDCGTATTFTAVDKHGTLHGGAILPGVGLWPEMLARRTAQLPRTRVTKPRSPVGRSPRESIESGIYHGHAGAIREVVGRLRKKLFPTGKTIVLGTGGNAALFAGENLFTKIEPRLILTGLIHFARSTDNA